MGLMDRDYLKTKSETEKQNKQSKIIDNYLKEIDKNKNKNKEYYEGRKVYNLIMLVVIAILIALYTNR